MSNVKRLDGTKLAGIGQLLFLAAEQLLALPPAQGAHLVGNLVLDAGAKWRELAGTIYTLSLDTEAEESQHGDSFSHELVGFFAGDSEAVAAQLQLMQGRRFVVLTRDYEGQLRLVGDYLGGLLFSYKLRSGKKPGERKGYEWTFKGRTPRPALFYSGSVPMLEGGIVVPPVDPGSGSGQVQVRSKSGRLLAIVPAGKTIILKSGFKLNFEII